MPPTVPGVDRLDFRLETDLNHCSKTLDIEDARIRGVQMTAHSGYYTRACHPFDHAQAPIIAARELTFEEFFYFEWWRTVSEMEGPTTIMWTIKIATNDRSANGLLPMADRGITTKLMNK
jgi:hypothetical protein